MCFRPFEDSKSGGSGKAGRGFSPAVDAQCSFVDEQVATLGRLAKPVMAHLEFGATPHSLVSFFRENVPQSTVWKEPGAALLIAATISAM